MFVLLSFIFFSFYSGPIEEKQIWNCAFFATQEKGEVVMKKFLLKLVTLALISAPVMADDIRLGVPGYG